MFLIVLLLWQPLSASAELLRSATPLQEFATCVGRLSAQMEYEWLFDGPASEVTQVQRAMMIELVAAIMDQGQGRHVLHWRIAAKQAHYALLTRATFNDDPADARWAQELAQTRRAECTGLLLS